MDNTHFEIVRPENLRLKLTQVPFPQSQDSNWSITSRTFNDNDLFICTRGEALFTVAGENIPLTAGCALLVIAGDTVSAMKTSIENFEAVAQHFDYRAFERLDFFSLFHIRRLVPFGSNVQQQRLLKEYLKAGAAGDNLLAHGLFNIILITVLNEAIIGERRLDDSRSFILSLAAALEHRFHEDDILHRLMNEVPYSYDYAARLFKQHMGTTPKQHLIQLRLKAARDYLVQGRSIKETSYLCGFRDELYFSRLFRKNEGISPKYFKLEHRGYKRLQYLT